MSTPMPEHQKCCICGLPGEVSFLQAGGILVISDVSWLVRLPGGPLPRAACAGHAQALRELRLPIPGGPDSAARSADTGGGAAACDAVPPMDQTTADALHRSWAMSRYRADSPAGPSVPLDTATLAAALELHPLPRKIGCVECDWVGGPDSRTLEEGDLTVPVCPNCGRSGWEHFIGVG